MMLHLKRTIACVVAILGTDNSILATEHFSATCMGTEFKILIDHESPAIRKKGAEEAFKECKRLNLIFSDYLADSEISRLSASSFSQEYIEISQELFDVLRFSLDLAKRTRGAFDPTLGQLSRTWRIARFRKVLPSSEKLKSALSLSGYEYLSIKERHSQAKIAKKGIILDLGGIAKGFAADQMMLKMKELGIDRCLIDAGGDLTIGEPPVGKSGWKINIGSDENSPFPSLHLSNCSVATSGDLEQFVEFEGKRYSHILDSKTGLGLQNQTQVTIVAEKGMIADAFATAAISMGPDKTYEQLIKGTNNKAFFLEGDSRKPRTIKLFDPNFNLDK